MPLQYYKMPKGEKDIVKAMVLKEIEDGKTK